MAKAYKEFPQNELVKHLYMSALWSVWFDNTTDYPSMSEDIIKLGTDLISTATDINIKSHTIQLLCFTYNHLGDSENAKKYASMSGSYWVTSNELLTNVLTGEELATHCQNNITSLIELINLNALQLRRHSNYTASDKIHILEFCNNMYRGVFEDDDFGFYACRLSQNYMDIAYEYASMNNAEECLNALEQVVKYAVMCDTAPDFKHTSLFVNRLSYEKTASTKNYTFNECSRNIRSIQHKAYDFIRDNPRFIKLNEDLRKYAN